ncbi:hypothetical protein GEMRC1_007031 [Eukaryota sp. GEM-RC1]
MNSAPTLIYPCYPFFGSYGNLPLPNTPGIIVATIEKANNIITNAAEVYLKTNNQVLGSICVDELQVVSDGQDRGSLLETLISKVLYTFPDCRIYGFSATISNYSLVGQWLNAEIFHHSTRAVPLFFHVVHKDRMLNKDGTLVRKLSVDSPSIEAQIKEIVLKFEPWESVLVFCATKTQAESLAHGISSYHEDQSSNLDHDVNSIIGKSRLFTCLSRGVGYHHGGLTSEHRSIVEKLFLEKKIRVIVATTSLSAGVDLPCRAVIVTSPFVGIRKLTSSELSQMGGRCGRKGQDARGDCFVLANDASLSDCLHLINGEVDPAQSNLASNDRLFERLILSIIVEGIATSPTSLRHFYRNTFFYYCKGRLESGRLFKQTLLSLQDSLSMIDYDLATQSFYPTSLGSATCASRYIPRDALSIHVELTTSLQSVCLLDEFQFCFHITSDRELLNHFVIDDPGTFWFTIMEECSLLPLSKRQFLDNLGWKVEVLKRFANGRPISFANDEHLLSFRVAVSIMLSKIVNEETLSSLSSRSSVSKGVLEELQSLSSMKANLLAQFCRTSGWDFVSICFKLLGQRLKHGGKADIIDSPLLRINAIGVRRARALIKHKIVNLEQLESVDLPVLMEILCVSESVAVKLKNNVIDFLRRSS